MHFKVDMNNFLDFLDLGKILSKPARSPHNFLEVHVSADEVTQKVRCYITNGREELYQVLDAEVKERGEGWFKSSSFPQTRPPVQGGHWPTIDVGIIVVSGWYDTGSGVVVFECVPRPRYIEAEPLPDLDWYTEGMDGFNRRVSSIEYARSRARHEDVYDKVLLLPAHGGVTLVTTDKYRLACSRPVWERNADKGAPPIPAEGVCLTRESLNFLRKIMKPRGMCLDNERACFQDDEGRVLTLPLVGAAMSAAMFSFPKEVHTSSYINKKELVLALGEIATGEFLQLTLRDGMALLLFDEAGRKKTAMVNALHYGAEFTDFFSIKRMLDSVKSMKTQQICISKEKSRNILLFEEDPTPAESALFENCALLAHSMIPKFPED